MGSKVPSQARLTGSAFPTTHWSVVDQAGQGAGEAKQLALADLVRQYMPALRSHLIRDLRLNADQADDFLQSFLLEKVLTKDVIRRAERTRGRFRNFLLITLDRFIANKRRHDQAKKRAPAKLVPLDESADESSRAPWGGAGNSDDGPAGGFDVDWASEVVAQAIEQMRHQCAAAARPDLWGVFEGRVLKPTLHGTDAVPYRELVETYDFVSPVQASNALVTANRMFARALRSVVGRYARDEREIEEEILDLRRILASRAGSG